MKNRFALSVTALTAVASTLLATAARGAEAFKETHRFVFYAVLEGCYEDGLSTDEAAQILRKDARGGYAHFIYACPLCTPALHALEAYRSRPARFYGLKADASTFGPGLASDLKQQLDSDLPEARLMAINAMVKRWITARKTMLRLSEPEQKRLEAELDQMREKGTQVLKRLETESPDVFKLSAFSSVGECAVCNGACGMGLKRRGQE